MPMPLRKGLQNGPDLLIRGPDFVIHFHERPAHNTLFVDDIRRRKGYTAPLGIEQAVAIDHPVARIRKKRKIGQHHILFGYPVHHLLQVFFGINGNCENLCVLLFIGVEQ